MDLITLKVALEALLATMVSASSDIQLEPLRRS